MTSQLTLSNPTGNSGLSRRILGYVVLASVIMAVVAITIHYQQVKSHFNDMLEEHLDIIQTGLLPALATEAYDDSYEELFMLLASVRQVPGVQYVELYSNIPQHEQQLQAGDPDLPYDEIRQWDLPQVLRNPHANTTSYLKAHISRQYIRDRMARESRKMLLIAGLQILILTLVYFAVFQLTVTRHLTRLANHLGQISITNLHLPMRWSRHRRSTQSPDELDIIAHHIDKLCQYLYTEITQREDALKQVENSKEFYRQIVEDQTEFIVRFDRHAKLTFVNQAFCRYMEMDRDQLLGTSAADYIHESQRREVYQVFMRLSPENAVLQQDILVDHPVMGPRQVSWKTRGYFDEQGHLSFVQTTGRDITERVRTLEALGLRNLAIESAPYGIAITDARQEDNPAVYVNPAFEKMTGYSSDEILGRNMRFLHRDDLKQTGLDQLRMAIANHRQIEVTLRNYRKDGTQFWVELIVAPMFDTHDNVTHFISIQTDVTERIQANERQKLLVNELDHRVKNVLATVIALSSQSIQTCPDMQRFKEVFTGRLHALARAHEALAREQWTGTNLDQLINLVLGHQLSHESDRISISGPNVRLLSRLSSPLSMVLHELLTNAMKYGALKNPDGRLTLTWERVADHLGETVEITWQEHCPVYCGCCDGSHRPGTGMRLINGLVSYEMNGTVEHTFTNGGLFCRITIPNHKNMPES